MKHNKMNFLKQAITNISTIGAIAPSSKKLAEKMIKHIDFSGERTILEFGAGSGVFTKALLQNMNEHSTLLSFELNENFSTELVTISDSKFSLIFDDVSNFKDHLKERKISKVDYIISGLPLAIFKKEFVDSLLFDISQVLQPDGKYIQFQYSTVSLKTIRQAFSKIQVDFTPFNIPPAFVYSCQK